jgi:hypothetical protein
VKKGESPSARVVYPEIVNGTGFLGPDTIVLDRTDEFTLITTQPTPLFHLDQTVPYRATNRTRAYFAFEEIFLKYSRKDCWIRKTDLATGEELEDWITETEWPFASRPHLRNRLTENLIRKHINQKQIIGLKGGELTRFILIDLDFHGRNLRVFEDQAEVLLNAFHGVGTWHYQVKHRDVTGIQFIHVFDEAKELKVVRNALRKLLQDLDRQHPELAKKAKAAGMKTLADLEIYPTRDNGNGVRLPLCRDREMLLDKPLPLVTYRSRQVQDVESYMRWLDDPHRQYMPKERILDYLHYFALEPLVPPTPPQPNPATSNLAAIDHKAWRGNLRRWLHEFWIEGNANDRLLNEHIAVLCRLAHVYGYQEADIIHRVSAFVRELPLCAASCSSRLLKRQYRSIDNVIRGTARYACQNNGHQHDSKTSTEIFAQALMRWPGCDPLDKTTWSLPVAQETVTPNWTEQQRRRLCAFFRRPLFVKDNDLIMRFIDGIVNLTLSKEKQSHGWGKEYLLKWMKSHFPTIKCAKDEKRVRIIRCLEEERIIQAVVRGQAGFATRWTLGPVAREALGMAGDREEEKTGVIPQESATTPNKNIYYYGSLFPKAEFLLESGCKEELAGCA